jgi:hypothetical protein
MHPPSFWGFCRTGIWAYIGLTSLTLFLLYWSTTWNDLLTISISDGYFNEQASNIVSYKVPQNVHAISLYLNRHGTSQPFWIHDTHANPMYFFKCSCRTSKSYYRLKINNPTELEPRWLKYNDIDKSVLNLSSVLKAFWYYNASQFDTAYESTP